MNALSIRPRFGQLDYEAVQPGSRVRIAGLPPRIVQIVGIDAPKQERDGWLLPVTYFQVGSEAEGTTNTKWGFDENGVNSGLSLVA